MQKQKVDILVIAIKNPILFGIYKDNRLIKTFISKNKTSKALPVIFKKILNRYDLKNLYYANGPGSYMAIKVAYIFLKTIAISKDIELFACSAFEFCNNMPIKALGKKFFVKEDKKVVLKTIPAVDTKFVLPKILNKDIFSKKNEPDYILPAI